MRRALEPEQVREWFEDRARFWQFAEELAAIDLDRLTEMKLEAESSNAEIPIEDRQQAYQDLASLVFRYLGGDPGSPANSGTISGWAQTAATAADAWARSGKPYPRSERLRPTPWGELGRIHKRGHGPVPFIIIVSPQHDWTQYKAFSDLNEDRYTTWIVTLAGFDNTAPPPLPEVRDFNQLYWWRGAAQGVLALLDRENIRSPVIMGNDAAAYLAARLALDHPEKFRAAVLLNGLVYAPLFPSFRSGPDGLTHATVEQRRDMANQVIPSDLGLPPTRMSPEEVERNLSSASPAVSLTYRWNVKDAARGMELYRKQNLDSNPATNAWYLNELATTDLSGDFAHLAVPTLIIPALHDEASPARGILLAISQWQDLALQYPDIPLTIAPFWDTRAYVSEERPLELSRAVRDFLDGRPVHGLQKRSDRANTSPHAVVSQTLGEAVVRVEYSRPGVKGRQIWGGLVPYGRQWRLGANEATRFSTTHDLSVEGRMLPAGSYSVFAIPGEKEWTVVFNRVDLQTGMGEYDPQWDVLRVQTTPVLTTEHREWMQFSFEALEPATSPPTSASLVLRWGELAVPIRIDAAP